MQYPLLVLAGVLLVNAVPHLVQGLSGAPFQSPFAKPPGVGESSPLVNVCWGFANLAGGIALVRAYFTDTAIAWALLAAGALLIGSHLAHHFGKVRARA